MPATGRGQAAAKLASRGADDRHGTGQYADESCNSIVILSKDSTFSASTREKASAAAPVSPAAPSTGQYAWSPHTIASCIAAQRSLCLRGGGADVHSAGLAVVKDAADGLLGLAFAPPLAVAGSSTAEKPPGV